MYLFLSTNNGSSLTNAPEAGLLSGSSFHPLNSVIPIPVVEHELELLELLDNELELELDELLELTLELLELSELELLELDTELELDELLELMLIE
jgi:hypothetical protein